ncbi:MAG: tetratricopeptide repeat protein [Planctomycetales bacterium]|nr:tetratricopeptide repeat protein [Planctomycetales bacterium]
MTPQHGPGAESLLNCRQLTQRGIAAMEQNDWETAEKSLEAAVASCDIDPESRRHYAESLWHRGDRIGATRQLDDAIKLSPDDATLYVRLAEMRLEMNQLGRASLLADEAVDRAPDSAAVWALRGRIKHRAGLTDEALGQYHRALSLAPSDPDILLEIADLYAELGQPRRALANLHSLAALYPPGEAPAAVLARTGLAYQALGREEDAAARLAEASNRPDATAQMYAQLAELQLASGRLADARQTASAGLARFPQHPDAMRTVQRVDAESASAPTGSLR